MTTNKHEKDLKEEKQDSLTEAQKNAFVNGQSPESVKKNPNPRANENLPDNSTSNNEDNTGVGSEITDGEDG